MKTSILLLLCFYTFIELYFLIPAVITQIFNPIVELVIRIGIPIKEAKAEIEIHPVIVESLQYNLELHKPFCIFYSSILLALFLQENNCFIYIFQS